MIPKTIHYCWFGGNPLPKMAQKCIASWKKHCPDYEIKEWNEENFDINCCSYVKEAYEAKKWAFVSDVARLYALVTEGGIYMDTDVEVLKSLDDLLGYEAVSGFESAGYVPTGMMACEKGHRMFVELLQDYDDAHFLKADGKYDTTTNCTRITKTCQNYGLVLNNQLQTVNGFTLFPNDYFCPKDYNTRKLTVTKNTYTIHHFDGSWVEPESRDRMLYKAKLARILPEKVADKYARWIAMLKHHGVSGVMAAVVRKVVKKK